MKVANFHKHMTAMRSHYEEDSVFTHYSLPIEVVNDIPLSEYLQSNDDSIARIREEIRQEGEKLQDDVDSISEYVQKSCRDVNDEKGSISDFQRQMEEKKKQAKERANKSIDRAFEKFVELGERYPERQGFILESANATMSFIANLFEGFVNFFANIAVNILRIFNDIVKLARDFFDDAKKIASNFFGGFFLSKEQSNQLMPMGNSLGIISGEDQQFNRVLKKVGEELKNKSQLAFDVEYRVDDEKKIEDLKDLIEKLNHESLSGSYLTNDLYPNPEVAFSRLTWEQIFKLIVANTLTSMITITPFAIATVFLIKYLTVNNRNVTITYGEFKLLLHIVPKQ